MAVLHVGPGRPYRSLGAAAAAAAPHDEIRIDPGTYDDDGAIAEVPLRVTGWGGMPVIRGRGLLRNGRALLLGRADLHVENVEFQGAVSLVGNGAGIRQDEGRLTVSRCVFAGNQNGIFLRGDPTISGRITDSHFARNGGGCGHTHAIYATERVGALAVGLCGFQDTVVGHHVKSRAARTVVTHCLMAETADGSTSYAVDVPNGGIARISENMFIKGRRSLSPKMVVYGAEASLYDDNRLSVVHNVFLNHRRGLVVGTLNYMRGVSALLERNGYEKVMLRFLGRGRRLDRPQDSASVASGAQEQPFGLHLVA